MRAFATLAAVFVFVVDTASANKSIRKSFCATGFPAASNDYDICCARSCGICAEHGCRAREGGPLNCCPLSGILASGEVCSARRQESCAVRRPPAQAESHVFRHFLKGDTPAGAGPVHVVVAGDHVHYVGLVAASESVFTAADRPDRVRLHVLAEPGPDVAALRAALACALGPPKPMGDPRRLDEAPAANASAPEAPRFHWEIVLFDAKDHFPANLTISAPNNAQKGNLAADLNYARFYLTALLPGVDKVVYLDADTIVNKDVSKLYDSALTESDAVLAAVPRDGRDVCYSLIDCEDERIRGFLAANGVPDPAADLNFFNAGVAVFHLGRWQRRGLTQRVEFWIRANTELGIYSLGSNPPLVLVVGDKFERVDPKWNCDGFGFKKPIQVTKECQTDAGVRHWSGHLKPWRRDGKYKHYFYPAVSDLNCLLELPRQPLEYEPDPEVEVENRVDVEDLDGIGAADRVPGLGEAVLGPIALGEDESISGNQTHRDREYKSVQAVSKATSEQLKRYGERADDLRSARSFVEQVRNHPSVSWDHIRNRTRDGVVECGAVDHVVVVIHNRTLYVDAAQYAPGKPCGAAPPRPVISVLKLIHTARAVAHLPDTIFILCVNPLGTTWADIPVLSFVKTRGDAQPGVLVPGPHFGKANMPQWDRQIRRYQESVQRFPWSQRIPSLFWRGRLVGLDKAAKRFGPDEHFQPESPKPCDDVANLARLEAVSATLRDERVADLKLHSALRDIPYVFGPEGGGCAPRWDEHVHKYVRDAITRVQARKDIVGVPRPPGDERPARLKAVNPNTLPRAVRDLFAASKGSIGRYMAHKFVASLPTAGGAAPPSRNEVWLHGAVVLLWKSNVQEWYYPALREGTTHVTIDGRTLHPTLGELRKDDKRARRLAIAAQEVHDNHLCPTCLVDHWALVLGKYNSRFGLRFLDIPATLEMLDAKARGEPVQV